MEQKKDSLTENDVNKLLEEKLREERTVQISVTCPMCMATMITSVEIGLSNAFFGNVTCTRCGRQYAVHGIRSIQITRIIPKWEAKCTDSQTPTLLGI